MTTLAPQRADLEELASDELSELAGLDGGWAREAALAEQWRRRRSPRPSPVTEWESAAYAQYLAADAACNGSLLSPLGRQRLASEWPGLWEGPETRARAYASEELRNYWTEHGRTPVVTRWRDQAATARREQASESEATTMNTTGTAIRAGAAAARTATVADPSTAQGWQAWRAQRRASAATVAVRPQDAPAKPQNAMEGRVTPPPARQVPDAPALLRRALEETGLLLADHVWFPSRASVVAIVLWIAQAAARGEDRDPIWDAYPRLLLTSRENGSGKSTVGDLARLLLQCRAGRASKITPYGLAKVLGKLHEVAIADDAQNIFRSDAAGRELLSVLVNGYTPGATWVTGKSGGDIEDAYGQVMIMGTDELITKRGVALKDLIARSVIVRLERPPRYMPQVNAQARCRAASLGDALRAVIGAVSAELREAVAALEDEAAGQAITEGDGGRIAQIWRPLHAVARVAGGPWPGAAQQAADELAGASGDLLAATGVLDGLGGGGRSFWDDEPEG